MCAAADACEIGAEIASGTCDGVAFEAGEFSEVFLSASRAAFGLDGFDHFGELRGCEFVGAFVEVSGDAYGGDEVGLFASG